MIVEFGPELSEGNEDEMKTFNEDIVCSHGTVPSLASRTILENSTVVPFLNIKVYLATTYAPIVSSLICWPF